MGASHSCGLRGSPGAALLAAVGAGDTTQAREILEQHPTAACYTTYVERNSPLLLAAGRGHHRLVQAIVEAAVMAAGAAKAKQRCINHTNQKGYSALILACMNGHAQVVESLVCNGASPLALDNSRHNTALHWAAACCRTDCVQRLLGSRATFQMQSGDVVPIADIPCFDEDNTTLVKFVDRHNGWGMTALHLAVFKGSSSTVRALLRNGAALTAVTVAAPLPNCPVSQPPGSTALHLAAAAEDLPLVRLLLEAQASQGAPDLRSAVNSVGERPLDAARSVSNLLLLHLLDPSQPLSLPPPLPHAGLLLDPPDADGLLPGGVLNVVAGWGPRGPRGLGFRGASRRGGARGDQPPHVALGSLLQRLRLVLLLEAVAVQERLAAAAAGGGGGCGGEQQQLLQEQLAGKAGSRKQQQQQQHPGPAGWDADKDNGMCDAGRADQGAGSKLQQAAACRLQDATECAALRGRLRAVQGLLTTINEMLAALPPTASGAAGAAAAGEAAAARQQQEQAGGGSSSGSRRRGGAGSGWGSLLARSSGGGGLSGSSAAAGPDSSLDPAVAAAAAGSGGGWSTAEVDELAAERVLSVFITPGTLSSLAAVTKLLVNASPLSGKQQQAVAAAAMLPGGAAGNSQQQAAAGAAAGSSSSNLARQQQQQQQQQQQDQQLFSEAWLPGSRANSGSGLDRLALGSGAAAPGAGTAAAAAPAADAGWAEQEHALVLMRSILQTAQASLTASQQAISAAASRVALRQRQEEQLAAVLRDGGRQRGPAALMGLGAGRRLLLGHDEPSREQAGRVRFGSASGTTSIGRNAGRDTLQRISFGSSSAGAGSSTTGSNLAWAVLDVPPSAAAASGAVGSSSSSRHRRHHHHHLHEHRRHSRGSSSGSRRSRVPLTVAPDPVNPTAAAALARRIPPSSSTSSQQPWPALLLPQQQQQEAAPLHLPQLRSTLTPRPSPAAAGSSSISSAVRGDASAVAAAPTADAAGTGLAARAAVAGGSAGGSTAGDASDSATSASSSSASRSSSTGRSSRSGSRASSSRALDSSPAPVYAAQTRAAQRSSSSPAAAAGLEADPSGGSSTDDGDAGRAAVDGAITRQLVPPHHRGHHHHHPQQQQQELEGEAEAAAAGPSRPASKHLAGQGPGSSCSSFQADPCEAEAEEAEAEAEEAAAVSLCSSLDAGTCAICMDAVAGLAVSGCCHSMCLQCAYKLCCKAKGVPLCPFCRQAVGGFDSRPAV